MKIAVRRQALSSCSEVPGAPRSHGASVYVGRRDSRGRFAGSTSAIGVAGLVEYFLLYFVAPAAVSLLEAYCKLIVSFLLAPISPEKQVSRRSFVRGN